MNIQSSADRSDHINGSVDESIISTAAGLLAQYLNSHGYDPQFINRNTRIAYSKSNSYKKWLSFHKFKESYGEKLDDLSDKEAEVLFETLSPSDPAATWIHDFVRSDNPKFAGKSKAKRIKMALAAHYGAQRIKESSPGFDSSDVNMIADRHAEVSLKHKEYSKRQPGSELSDKYAESSLRHGMAARNYELAANHFHRGEELKGHKRLRNANHHHNKAKAMAHEYKLKGTEPIFGESLEFRARSVAAAVKMATFVPRAAPASNRVRNQRDIKRRDVSRNAWADFKSKTHHKEGLSLETWADTKPAKPDWLVTLPVLPRAQHKVTLKKKELGNKNPRGVLGISRNAWADFKSRIHHKEGLSLEKNLVQDSMDPKAADPTVAPESDATLVTRAKRQKRIIKDAFVATTSDKSTFKLSPGVTDKSTFKKVIPLRPTMTGSPGGKVKIDPDLEKRAPGKNDG